MLSGRCGEEGGREESRDVWRKEGEGRCAEVCGGRREEVCRASSSGIGKTDKSCHASF